MPENSRIPYHKYEKIVLDKFAFEGCTTNDDKKRLLGKRMLVVRSGWRRNHTVEETYDDLLNWCCNDPFPFEDDQEHWVWLEINKPLTI